ncbi:MAG: hypothetical protein ACFFDT_18360 [Candidatus Hodarchaeota archaeon]
MSEILKFLFANPTVLIILVSACCVLLICLIGVFIIALRQGREISLWHLKIGAKPLTSNTHAISQSEEKKKIIQIDDEGEKEAMLETFFNHIESEGIQSTKTFKIIAKTFQNRYENKKVLSIGNEEIIKILIKYTKKWLQQYSSRTQNLKETEYLSGLGLITIANISVPTDTTKPDEGITFINNLPIDESECNYITRMLDNAKTILKENKPNFDYYIK